MRIFIVGRTSLDMTCLIYIGSHQFFDITVRTKPSSFLQGKQKVKVIAFRDLHAKNHATSHDYLHSVLTK